MSAPLLPNPYTSLAWLPPKVADEVEFTRYLAVATYGVGVAEDIKLFKKYPFSLADAVYLLARLSVLGCLTAITLFAVAQVDDCDALGKASVWFTTLYSPPNSFLFLLRIRAVFHDSKLVIRVFILMWLAIVAGAFVQPFCLEFAHIGLSRNCTLTTVKPFCSFGTVALTVYDSLVVVAISLRLLFYNRAGPGMTRYRMFFGGRGMPHISMLLVQTGQQYYIVTAAMNIFTAVVLLTPSIPPVYRAVVATPCVAVNNVMACRVYRKVKLGAITDGATSTLSTPRMNTLEHSSVRFASDTSTQNASLSMGTKGLSTETDPVSTTQRLPEQPELTQGGRAAVYLDFSHDDGNCVPAGWNEPEVHGGGVIGALSESRQEV